ncbi:hypothetical protein Asppvi_001323 [Aspergillus pseudoviridinutans]|uniref:Zn(2)-C6 fungal-type domain-containing protein n=1 Tax=Aspergillus pseudoviridinutans TaxID=1517512 RepID=A0A9P3ER98_9EURO|nr:uncharacterized protein Asppvi_001323 [Aspergillus pseudoviridinutans]GIJ82808.1 hypothetical protein Asppvi_001323 [Aspergillus pseudoviridinutans]
MSGRKRRIDDVDNSDNDSRKKQARVPNLGSGANSGQSSSVLNAEAVAKAPNTTAAVASQPVSGEALGTKTAPAEAEQSRDKGKQRQEQVEEAKEAAKEAAGRLSVDNKESTAGPSTESSKQPRVKRQRRKKTDPVPDPVEKALSRIENNPTKRTDRACDNCRVQKLKCDNDPDGCAQCVKRSMQCTLTLATQKTYVRGAPQETGQARDGLNLEVERLREDVNLLQQDVILLRRDLHLLRQENMQLRRELAGLQAGFPNQNQYPWNPPPAEQAPPHAPYEVPPQAQAAGQGAGHMPLPVSFLPAGQETLYPELPANPPLEGQGAGYLPFPENAPLAGPGAGNPAPPPNLPLVGPGLLNFPPAPNLPPVIQEPANFLPAPTTPPPGQGSPSVRSDSSSPYRTSSEASTDNDDTNSGATNNDPAFANQIVPPMTELGGAQPALEAQQLGYQDTMADPTAISGLDDDFLEGFVAQPADLNDLNDFNVFNASGGDNGDDVDNGGDPIDLLMLPADRARLAGFTNQPSYPSAANAAGPATDPLTIDPAQLNLQPVDYPQVASPTTTQAMADILRYLQNGRDNDGPQQN